MKHLPSVLFLSLLVLPVAELHAANDGQGCASELQHGASESSAEGAVARAWMETLLQDAGRPGIDVNGVLARIQDRLQHGALAADVLEVPVGLLSADVASALEGLSRMVEGLVESGSIREERLVSLLHARIRDHLGAAQSESGTLEDARSARGRSAAPAQSIQGSGGFEEPLLLEDGTLVAASVDGEVIFVDRAGSVLARRHLGRYIERSPIALAGGRVLVLSAFGAGWVFGPDGRLLSPLALGDARSWTSPVRLIDGRWMLLEASGKRLLVEPAGESSTIDEGSGPVEASPIRLSDGRVVIVGLRGSVVFLSAQGAHERTALLGTRIDRPAVQFPGGRVFVVDTLGRGYLFNADGSQVLDGGGDELHVELGGRPVQNPVLLAGGRVAIPISRSRIAMVDSSGKLFGPFDVEGLLSRPLLPLPDGSLLAIVENPDAPADSAGAISRIDAAGGSEVVWKSDFEEISTGIGSLSGGGWAFGTYSGSVRFLDAEFSETGRLEAGDALALTPVELPDGRIATGTASGELLLIDPRVAKGEFSF